MHANMAWRAKEKWVKSARPTTPSTEILSGLHENSRRAGVLHGSPRCSGPMGAVARTAGGDGAADEAIDVATAAVVVDVVAVCVHA